MVALLRPMTALFLSAAIVLCGNGLETVLLPIRAAIQNFTRLEIGLIGSAYWLGITIGCILCPRIIARVGYIRAFTVFTAVATVSPLLEAIWQIPVLWWVLRGLVGVCFAGILTVLESWLNGTTANDMRGRVLSAYTMTNFGVIIIGQQLLNLASPAGFQLFTVSAILFSLASVPLALTLSSPPAAPREPAIRPAWLYRISPAAVIGSAGAGLANGAFWALGPVYATATGLSVSQAAGFMSCAVLGGALAQWPIGRWSDKADRRLALVGMTLAASVLGLLLFIGPGLWAFMELLFAFLFGAAALPVYSISLAHANDHASAAESVDVSSNLLLIFAISAIAGPVFGSFFAGVGAGAGGLFFYTALVHLIVAGLVYLRMRTREPVPPELRDAYVPLPQKSSMQVYELDPRAAPEDGEEAEGEPGGVSGQRPLLSSPEEAVQPKHAEQGKFGDPDQH
jgi:MFS family permease